MSKLKRSFLYIFAFIGLFSTLMLSVRGTIKQEDSQIAWVENTSTSNSTSSPNNLSFLLESIIQKHQIPGMVGCVLKGNFITAVGAAGVRVDGFPEKVKITDSFHLGSCTKSMTAFLCALLVEEGLLEWDLKVVDLFPELQHTIDPAYQSLTLRQLLTHRGGLPANVNYLEIQKEAHNDLILARQIVMERVLAEPPAITPGDYLYSNVGYVIAGHMTEKVTGQVWEEQMKDKIFAPLQMFTAGFGAPDDLNVHSQPWGHRENGTSVKPGYGSDNPETLGPAGTVHSSILDWAKYISLQLLGAEGKPTFLTESSYITLQTPAPNPPPEYAMGWAVATRPWAKGTVLHHNGSNTYWYAVVWIAPHINTAIMVICNKGGSTASAASDEAIQAIIHDQLN